MTSTDLDGSQMRGLITRLAPEGADPALDGARRARAVWSCLIEPGDATAGAVIAGVGAEEGLHRVRTDTLHALVDQGVLTAQAAPRAAARWRPRLVPGEIVFALETAARSGIRLVIPGDDAWPPAVDDLGVHAPVCLWVRGRTEALAAAGPSVAIVGARAASGYGEHIAAELASELAGRGIPIVSGGAYGIDGAAHRAALAAGGITIALSAGGVDRAYPAGHTDLLARIARDGAVVGEAPCGTAPTRWRFLQRNRSIAALGAATVVVEAGARSGSLNTAGHAAQLGRPLGAVPGPVTSGSSAGCHHLLREYDARCVTCAEEVAELLGLDRDATRPPALAGDRTDEGTRVMDALTGRSSRSVDEIARRSGMEPAQVSAQLGILALAGRAQTDGSGWRRATTGAAR